MNVSVYQFLIKRRSARGSARSPAHRCDADGLPLCGTRLNDEDWDLARSPRRGQRICSACELVAARAPIVTEITPLDFGRVRRHTPIDTPTAKPAKPQRRPHQDAE